MNPAMTLAGWSAGSFLEEKTSNRSKDGKDVFEKGDFRLDLSARSASVRGTQLDLTADEFNLLRFLLLHPKNLVTSHTVLVSNGGVRRTDFMKTLLSLRRKLDTVTNGEPYLRTEPWVLYRFDCVSGSR